MEKGQLFEADEEDLIDEEGATKRAKISAILSDDEEEITNLDGEAEESVGDASGREREESGEGLGSDDINTHQTKKFSKSSIKISSALVTLIQRDDLSGLKRVLFASSSSSKSKGEGNLVDVLLVAASANAVNVTSFLLQTDVKALLQANVTYVDVIEEDQKFKDLSLNNVLTRDEELCGASLSLNSSSILALQLMSMGKCLLEPHSSSGSWGRIPFLVALYEGSEGVVRLYCKHMQAHAMAVLASIVPEDQQHDEPIPVIFDLLQPSSYFTLLVALQCLGKPLAKRRTSVHASALSHTFGTNYDKKWRNPSALGK